MSGKGKNNASSKGSVSSETSDGNPKLSGTGNKGNKNRSSKSSVSSQASGSTDQDKVDPREASMVRMLDSRNSKEDKRKEELKQRQKIDPHKKLLNEEERKKLREKKKLKEQFDAYQRELRLANQQSGLEASQHGARPSSSPAPAENLGERVNSDVRDKNPSVQQSINTESNSAENQIPSDNNEDEDEYNEDDNEEANSRQSNDDDEAEFETNQSTSSEQSEEALKRRLEAAKWVTNKYTQKLQRKQNRKALEAAGRSFKSPLRSYKGPRTSEEESESESGGVVVGGSKTIRILPVGENRMLKSLSSKDFEHFWSNYILMVQNGVAPNRNALIPDGLWLEMKLQFKSLDLVTKDNRSAWMEWDDDTFLMNMRKAFPPLDKDGIQILGSLVDQVGKLVLKITASCIFFAQLFTEIDRILQCNPLGLEMTVSQRDKALIDFVMKQLEAKSSKESLAMVVRKVLLTK